MIPCIADMKNGFYEKVESQLQGFQNTYFVGGLLAFELTERNALYSISAVCKHFAIASELPMIPYVKVSQKYCPDIHQVLFQLLLPKGIMLMFVNT